MGPVLVSAENRTQITGHWWPNGGSPAANLYVGPLISSDVLIIFVKDCPVAKTTRCTQREQNARFHVTMQSLLLSQ